MNLRQRSFTDSVQGLGAQPAPFGLIEGHETLIPMSELPKMLPLRPNGKRVHISACYRWAGRGVHGVKLEVVRIGGSTYTSREALARFSARLSSPVAAPNIQLAGHRERQIREAEARLNAMLSSPTKKGK